MSGASRCDEAMVVETTAPTSEAPTREARASFFMVYLFLPGGCGGSLSAVDGARLGIDDYEHSSLTRGAQASGLEKVRRRDVRHLAGGEIDRRQLALAVGVEG